MPINKEIENLVLDYCNAAANLYYCIPVKKLMEIYNSQNDPLSEEDFCNILEKILETEQFFDVFSEEEILTGKSDDTPIINKELLAEHLFCSGDFDEYLNLKESTYGIPYCVIEKDKFLKYTDELYVEKTPEFISLRAYFRNLPNLKREEADDLALEAAVTLRLFNRDPESILNTMELLGIAPKTQSEFDIFTGLCFDMGCNIRLASLRGATVAETEE